MTDASLQAKYIGRHQAATTSIFEKCLVHYTAFVWNKSVTAGHASVIKSVPEIFGRTFVMQA